MIDLGIGSVASVRHAFQKVSNQPVEVIAEGPVPKGTRLLVMPGNGNFDVGARKLDSSRLRNEVKGFVEEQKGNFAGICLGMQLMGTSSQEAPAAAGLGLLDAHAEKLKAEDTRHWKLPNIGWRPLIRRPPSFGEIAETRDVFFSHSFFFETDNSWEEQMTSRFDEIEITAAIRHRNMVGFQFHPEKSSTFGLELLRQTVEWSGIYD